MRQRGNLILAKHKPFPHKKITGSLSIDAAHFLPCIGHSALHSLKRSLLLPLHKTLPLPPANYSHMLGTSHGMPHIFSALAQARCVPPCHRLIVNTMRTVVPLFFSFFNPFCCLPRHIFSFNAWNAIPPLPSVPENYNSKTEYFAISVKFRPCVPVSHPAHRWIEAPIYN